MPDLALPPTLTPQTWSELFAAAAAFGALKPWTRMYDREIVGLTDPRTGETHIGCVLGNAGEVFGAVFYRRPAGIRWILTLLESVLDELDLSQAEGIDCLKLEFVPKRELTKADLAVIRLVGFEPSGRGSVWPQFRSALPGWHPWYIDEKDAAELLADLRRLTAFCDLRLRQPELGRPRSITDVPFLPVSLSEGPLGLEDLDWRPVVLPPSSDLTAYQPSEEALAPLRALPLKSDITCEFDSAFLPGGSFLDQGRPCFGRVSLLVEHRGGFVLGTDVTSGALPVSEAAGHGLMQSLLHGGFRPGVLCIQGERLKTVLEPLCAALGIQLRPSRELPMLRAAAHSLYEYMTGGRGN